MSAEDIARKMLELRILPRFMMIVMTCVYVRCIEWALSQPDSLAVWLNSEKG